MQSIFCDDNKIKLEINKMMKFGKVTNIRNQKTCSQIINGSMSRSQGKLNS